VKNLQLAARTILGEKISAEKIPAEEISAEKMCKIH